MCVWDQGNDKPQSPVVEGKPFTNNPQGPPFRGEVLGAECLWDQRSQWWHKEGPRGRALSSDIADVLSPEHGHRPSSAPPVAHVRNRA